MPRREIVIGLLLSVAVTVGATFRAVFAKGVTAARHTHNGNESFLQHAPTLGGTALGASSRGPLTAQHKTLSNTNPRGTGATYKGATNNSLSLAGAAHPKQGYHVKMTYTSTDGNAQGSTV